MHLTRRTMMLSATAFGLLAPVRSWATVEMGNLRIDTLSDGNLVLPGGMLLEGRDVTEATTILAGHGLGTDQFTPDCNVTLLRDGTNSVLFDVGAGANFQPSAGKLAGSLETLGVSPEEVTHVLFTHAHPDHLWGVLDDFDEPVFINARHMISRTERDYWLDPNTPDSIGEARMAFAAGAIRYLEALGDGLEVFEDGDEPLSGIAAVGTHGHTPGHTSFEVRNGSESLMIVGDAIGNHHVAFEAPSWAAGSDQNTDEGAATRVALLDRLAAEQMPMIGYHFPFPGVARAEKSGDAFRFVAA